MMLNYYNYAHPTAWSTGTCFLQKEVNSNHSQKQTPVPSYMYMQFPINKPHLINLQYRGKRAISIITFYLSQCFHPSSTQSYLSFTYYETTPKLKNNNNNNFSQMDSINKDILTDTSACVTASFIKHPALGGAVSGTVYFWA